jgi:hypothetical protein
MDKQPQMDDQTQTDSPLAIADDLDQLATEVAGNESRPSAEDISLRVRQCASRLRDLVSSAGGQSVDTPGPKHVDGFTMNDPRLAAATSARAAVGAAVGAQPSTTPPVAGVDDYGLVDDDGLDEAAAEAAAEATPPAPGNEL